jgi:hypothetical protein
VLASLLLQALQGQDQLYEIEVLQRCAANL